MTIHRNHYQSIFGSGDIKIIDLDHIYHDENQKISYKPYRKC